MTWRPTATCSPSGVAVIERPASSARSPASALYLVNLEGRREKRIKRFFHNDFGRIRTVQKAPDGSLWITTSNRDGRGNPARIDDRVIRIRLP